MEAKGGKAQKKGASPHTSNCSQGKLNSVGEKEGRSDFTSAVVGPLPQQSGVLCSLKCGLGKGTVDDLVEGLQKVFRDIGVEALKDVQ